jgi:branched-chain amino acid transport system ATP-binding protein
MTVLDNLRVPLEYAARDRAGSEPAEEEAMRMLAAMGLAERAHEDSARLTQIDMRKLELARALAAKPRLLISDEAMAGLSAAEVGDVLAILFRLNESGIAVIMIEHIMQAVMRFSQRVICLDAGQIICEGTPATIVADPGVQRAYLGA